MYLFTIYYLRHLFLCIPLFFFAVPRLIMHQFRLFTFCSVFWYVWISFSSLCIFCASFLGEFPLFFSNFSVISRYLQFLLYYVYFWGVNNFRHSFFYLPPIHYNSRCLHIPSLNHTFLAGGKYFFPLLVFCSWFRLYLFLFRLFFLFFLTRISVIVWSTFSFFSVLLDSTCNPFIFPFYIFPV